MNKERIKNLLLVFLIAMNFILGSRILFERKLWPSGYNFFSNLELTSIYHSVKGFFSNDTVYKSRFLSPEKIMINTGDQTTRLSLNSADAEFDSILEEAYMVLQKALSDDTITINQISREEFYSALNQGSVYLEYSADYKAEIFARLIGTTYQKTTKISNTFSDVAISYSPKTCVYIADIENSIFYKMNANKSSENLVIKIGECIEKRQGVHPIINYSFDLRFDQPFGSQKTTLNPLIQVYSETEEYPVITSKNPVSDETVLNNILKVFQMNPNTISRYTQAGGTSVFVENNATLKIDKDGYLEYEKTIISQEINDEYSVLTTVATLADGVNKAIKNDSAMSISKAPDSLNGTISLDYTAGGLRIIPDSDKLSNAVVAVIENGQLISYKQLLRNYELTNKKTKPMEFLQALDEAISEYSKSMNEININKMYIGYRDDSGIGEKNAQWIVNVDNLIINE